MTSLFSNPLIGLAVPVLLLGAGFITSITDGTRATRQELARNTAQTEVQHRLETAQSAARSALAVSRYQGGCVHLAQGQLLEGATYQGSHGGPLPDGTVLCDSYGGTAVMRNGVASDLAQTADLSVVRAALGW